MATVISSTAIEQIGDAAGAVWHLLDSRGPLAMTELVKKVDAPRDVVMQAIGWLAREDKLTIDEERRKKIVSLI